MTEQDRHGIDPDEATRELDDAPSVDGLLKKLGGLIGVDASAGWGEIENVGQAMAKQRREASAAVKREANIFRDTFSTEAGKKCLAIMVDMTVKSQPYPAEAMLPMEAITPLVIAHNAQCNFVWSILAAIAQAENKEAKPRTFQP